MAALDQYREAFDLFVSRTSGGGDATTIPSSDLGSLFRSLGAATLPSSPAETEEYTNAIDPDKTGHIERDAFIAFMLSDSAAQRRLGITDTTTTTTTTGGEQDAYQSFEEDEWMTSFAMRIAEVARTSPAGDGNTVTCEDVHEVLVDMGETTVLLSDIVDWIGGTTHSRVDWRHVCSTLDVPQRVIDAIVNGGGTLSSRWKSSDEHAAALVAHLSAPATQSKNDDDDDDDDDEHLCVFCLEACKDVVVQLPGCRHDSFHPECFFDFVKMQLRKGMPSSLCCPCCRAKIDVFDIPQVVGEEEKKQPQQQAIDDDHREQAEEVAPLAVAVSA